MTGYILAMVGLFTAVSALISFITTLDVGNAMGMKMSELTEMGSIGTAILFGILSDLGMCQFDEMMAFPDMGVETLRQELALWVYYDYLYQL